MCVVHKYFLAAIERDHSIYSITSQPNTENDSRHRSIFHGLRPQKTDRTSPTCNYISWPTERCTATPHWMGCNSTRSMTMMTYIVRTRTSPVHAVPTPVGPRRTPVQAVPLESHVLACGRIIKPWSQAVSPAPPQPARLSFSCEGASDQSVPEDHTASGALKPRG